MCVLSFIYIYVQVSDTKTGQESEDEWSKEQIHVVIHWPNGVGIQGSKV
jgi:hypothetical protein